ncbi:aminotransferase class V-fold PLP-dependent enzyme [Anaerolinea thermophila]|uniref:cysteine desulfurase n=1 Tax=Anaerolinea thermophila (strain DSM 14523 / JCM 11388 / NBRC 100420 / UNI-1) TaxID=926569 RepID=E8N5V6_ANATU|nr:cysteine desulfurase [Anaerolinea thermophila]BAJ63820.1 cysteine desulfurase/selenocysteine lyase [Anaerolinea thermophila UNI-1]
MPLVEEIRRQFPILHRQVRKGVPLVYLDSAATSQKPLQVIETMQRFYQLMNANIHRGVHTLAEEATAAYEKARDKVASFIGATSSNEVIYTRNTTEAINLVANSWGRKFLHPGDVIILTEMEHHSNLVPWQMLASEKGLRLEFIPVREDFLLDLDAYRQLLDLRPKLVAFTHMSNVLGTINPAKEIIRLAHEVGALTLVDGAQSVPHFPVNVQDLDADFVAFSAHKMCGPTGIGILYGKQEILDKMPPFLGGGDMIKKVYLRDFVPNSLPHKFEAGTPAIAEAIGLGAAVDFLQEVGMDWIHTHEQEITAYALERLSEVPGLKFFGPEVRYKGGVISFTMQGVHPHDVAQILDREGIAVRAGHHCAMPLHDKFHIPATTRASFYLYSSKEEVDKLVAGLEKVLSLFG